MFTMMTGTLWAVCAGVVEIPVDLKVNGAFFQVRHCAIFVDGPLVQLLLRSTINTLLRPAARRLLSALPKVMLNVRSDARDR